MAPLPTVYALPAGKPPGKLVNRENWGTQLSAGAHHAALDMNDPDPEPNGLQRFKMYIVHLTTPVVIAKSHYYWAMARDHGAPYDYEQLRGMADVVFGEDIGVVEATQAMVRRAVDHEDAVEFSVSADRAAIEGRRLVAAQVEAEKAHWLKRASK